MALLGLLVVSACCYYQFGVRWPKQRQAAAVQAGWQRFDKSAQQGDTEGMLAGLDEILIVEPNNAFAVSRKQALISGDADGSDPAMTLLTLRRHLQAGNWPEADREAAKRLEQSPLDWTALITRGWAAWRRGDKEATLAFLEQLPAPDGPQARLDPVGLLLAFELHRETDTDPALLLGYLRTALLHNLRRPAVQAMPATVKLQLVELYLQPFTPWPGRTFDLDGYASAWSAVIDLAERAYREAVETGNRPVLATIGKLTARLDRAAVQLHDAGQVQDRHLETMRQELRDLATRSWRHAIELDPTQAEAHCGLARLHWQADNQVAAQEAILVGIDQAGEDPELYALHSAILQSDGRADEAADILWKMAEKHADRPVWWVLAAEASVAAQRPDKVLQACSRGRQLAENHPILNRLEAGYWLDAGDAHKAIERLHQFDKERLARDPALAEVYVRALVQAGLGVLIDDFLEAAAESARARNEPAALATAFATLCQYSREPKQLDRIAEQADRLSARWPDSLPLLRLRAEAVAKAAECSDWDVGRVAQALAILDRVRAKQPLDVGLACHAARLRLQGQQNPEAALAVLATLLETADTNSWPVGQLVVAAAVLTANRQPEPAVRLLEQAMQSGPLPTEPLATLALAYHQLGRTAEARTMLEQAEKSARSERDRSAIQHAYQTITSNPE